MSERHTTSRCSFAGAAACISSAHSARRWQSCASCSLLQRGVCCISVGRGYDCRFLQVDSLSAVDIIVLFASAALGVAASCTDAWLLRGSSSCCTATSWRLRRLMGHGQWINGRCWQGCTVIGSVCACLCRMWGQIGHFRVHLSVACDWCGLGWAYIDGSV